MSAAERLAPPLRIVPTREARVRLHGRDPIAVSTLQPGLEFFENAAGFVAYGRALGVSLSLGGPVSAATNTVGLARAFLKDVDGAALFYVDEPLAFSLGRGTFRASLGTDRVLDLHAPETFASEQTRSAMRKAAKVGLQLEELDLDALGTEDAAFIDRVSNSALERSVVPYEMRFLNRPMTLEPGPSRVFALRQRGERFGYAVLDPYFQNGRIRGYLLNLLRFEPTSLWGVYLSTVEMLGRLLLREGVGELSLGFCPLANVDLENTSALLRPQLAWLARRYANIDYFARLAAMKGQLHGTWQQRWLVSRTPQLVTPMLAFLSLTGVPLKQLARERLAAAWSSWRKAG